MALNLDTRQRAMLQEMGITVWMPKPAALAPAMPAADTATAAPLHDAVAAAETHAPLPAVAAAATPTAVAAPAVVAAPTPTPSPLPTPAAATQRATPAPVTAAPTAAAPPSAEWHIAPAVQAYPTATGGSADDAWLVIWECPHPSAPLEGDTGKLLNNMLRALRLHHSPHVWIAGVQRPGHEALPVAGIAAAPVTWQPLAQGLPTSVQQAKPARILVLGLHAARAVLGSQEALGRLRAQVHQVQQIPAVVSYDPAYLLRSPHAKPAAWADLCRAHALRPPSR